MECNRKVTIGKAIWDSVFLQRLEEATDVSKTAEVAAVIMTEGLAHICLVTPSMTITRQKIEVTVPKKRYEVDAHNKVRIHSHFFKCYY